MAAKRRRGDATQPEDERANPQTKYRIPAAVADEIAVYAAAMGVSRSDAVAAAWSVARASGRLDEAVRAEASKKDQAKNPR